MLGGGDNVHFFKVWENAKSCQPPFFSLNKCTPTPVHLPRAKCVSPWLCWGYNQIPHALVKQGKWVSLSCWDLARSELPPQQNLMVRQSQLKPRTLGGLGLEGCSNVVCLQIPTGSAASPVLNSQMCFGGGGGGVGWGVWLLRFTEQ